MVCLLSSLRLCAFVLIHILSTPTNVRFSVAILRVWHWQTAALDLHPLPSVTGKEIKVCRKKSYKFDASTQLP
jgi:hypothetical protein